MYQGSAYRPHASMDTSPEPTMTSDPGRRAYAYHADDDTPCDSPGPCSFTRLVYWRMERL